MTPRSAAVGAVLLAAPATAMAHLTDTGLGPVYDGIAHVLMSFDDLLPVVALAMVAGLNGAREGRLALFTLPLGWLLGGVAGVSWGMFTPPAWAPALSLLALGVLTAASVRLAPPLVVALSAALGLVHGSLNGAGLNDAGRDATALLGIVATVFVVLALVGALVVTLRKPWTRIAVRVAGSWVAAVGLLMAGWGIRAALA
ncbi:MAG TPA: HupE/UreJ family protein [Burkholderiaceae bacterium]|nr:HupE/UreJ family protein [Burkholderiaceae bacterium]